MKNILAFFLFTLTLSSQSWAYTNQCKNQINNRYVKKYDGSNESSVIIPKNLDEAQKLVYDYATHPLDKSKYLQMLKQNQVVVFSSNWSSSIYDGANLIILSSQNCQQITSFVIRRAD